MDNPDEQRPQRATTEAAKPETGPYTDDPKLGDSELAVNAEIESGPSPHEPRGKPNGSDPWCWQTKGAFRRIREMCMQYGTGIPVYVALTEVDSDHGGSGVVEITHKALAGLAGFSVRTVQERLKDLERIGVIKIERHDPKGACTYILIQIGNGCRPIGNRSAISLPISRYNKETKKQRNVERDCSDTGLTTAESIRLEKKLKILNARYVTLRDDLTDRVQQQSHPEMVRELKDIQGQIKDIEDRLLKA